MSFDLKNIEAKQQYGNDYTACRLATSYTWNIW
jgi:hypothetical protein